MEKYNSKNASYPNESGFILRQKDDPIFVGKVDYPHIIFNKEDGSCGMEVSLEEIVDVWLDRLEPEQQQTLELEQKTRSEMRELATLRQEKKYREEDEKREQVRHMLKPFLTVQLLNVLSNRGLEITKSNIRNLIGECREKSWVHSTKYQYNPMGILFTEKEWDEFREGCNKIIMNGNPKNWVGIFDDYKKTVEWSITPRLTELRDTPISFWK
jgi:hypothetical protein